MVISAIVRTITETYSSRRKMLLGWMKSPLLNLGAKSIHGHRSAPQLEIASQQRIKDSPPMKPTPFRNQT